MWVIVWEEEQSMIIPILPGNHSQESVLLHQFLKVNKWVSGLQWLIKLDSQWMTECRDKSCQATVLGRYKTMKFLFCLFPVEWVLYCLLNSDPVFTNTAKRYLMGKCIIVQGSLSWQSLLFCRFQRFLEHSLYHQSSYTAYKAIFLYCLRKYLQW